MPNILLTKEAADSIAAKAVHPFRATGVRLENGMVSIPVDAQVYDALEQRRFDGETMSDCVVRVVGTASGAN